MSASDSTILRSLATHVGKENSMLPPLTSPNSVLTIARGQKYNTPPKSGRIRRPNPEDGNKVNRSTSPAPSDQCSTTEQRRIQQLEKAIAFMQEHHEKILTALYQEIEELKRKNRELNFRLVMSPASLPAHLLSPEEDQQSVSAGSSPRHLTSAAQQPAAHTVQLELLEGELAQLQQQLTAEREHNQQLTNQLEQLELSRSAADGAADRLMSDVQARLKTAEAHVQQLRGERDELQREVRRMRTSLEHRPPWRTGGRAEPKNNAKPSQSVGPAVPPRSRPAAAPQQHLPRILNQSQLSHRPDTRGSITAPPRPQESRTSSQGSLPVLPRSRAARQQGAPPPPPPRKTSQ